MLSDIGEREFKKNKIFETIPKGIIITDTYNCPRFPLQDIEIDKSNIVELSKLRREYISEYNARISNFLPYHFTIEYIKNRYETFTTRPLMYKSLVYGYENYITVAIVGDSNKDVYSKHIYIEILNTINSFRLLPGWRLRDIQFVNLGPNFQQEQILKKLL